MLNGIDVSSYQPATPDLAGQQFLFIKATEGTSYVNPKQSSQAAAGRVAGCVVGFYHYVNANSSMQAQAQYFVDQCDSVPGDLLVIDWEESSVSCADKDAILAAVKNLRPTHRVLLYCNVDYWLNIDTTSDCGDGLWIADYSHPAGQPAIQHPWTFHQYSDAPQDLDVGNFASRTELQAWAAGTSSPPANSRTGPAPAPSPAPPSTVPQWRTLLDHVMAVPEQVYEHWDSSDGWDNITQFGAEYGEDGVSWCVIYDWDMYHDVGLDAVVPRTDNVSDFTNWAQTHGQWSEYPSVGAWVNFGDGAHTEIVTGFDADTVYTKGGNSVQAGATDNGQGNGVWSHSHARRSAYVTGYLAPHFPDGQCPPTADPQDPRGGAAQTSYRWPGPAAPAPLPAPTYLEEEMLSYLPPIVPGVDLDLPVEPAGTLTKPAGGANNGPMWLCLAPQGGDGQVTTTMHTEGGAWGTPAAPVTVTQDGSKYVLSLPAAGIDKIRIRTTVPLLGYLTGRQIA